MSASSLRPRDLAVLFLLGCAIAPIGDAVHIRTGTTAYLHEGLRIGYSPPWFPLVVGVGAAIGGWIRLRLPTSATPVPTWAVALPILATIGVHAGSGLLPWSHGGLNDLVLAALALGTWALVDRSGPTTGFALGAALAGTVGEIVSVAIGMHRYAPDASQLLGVATWLPWVYFTAGVAVSQTARWLRS